MRDVTRIAGTLDLAAMGDAVEASSDHLATPRVVLSQEMIWTHAGSTGDAHDLGRSSAVGSIGSSTTGGEVTRSSGPLAAARMAGAMARQELLDRGGGAYRGEELAGVLGISRQAVDNRQKRGKLLAMTLARRGYHYPAWQVHDGRVLDGLDVVLATLADHDPWSRLAFMLNPNTWLDDEAPLDVLRRDRVEAVRDAASVYGEQVAA